MELALHRGFVQVVACHATGSGMGADFGRGEQELPRPFLGGVGVFAAQRLGEVGFAHTRGQVLLMASSRAAD